MAMTAGRARCARPSPGPARAARSPSASYSGGAIYNYNGGTLAATNSTFSGNSASYSGGAIYNYNDGTATFYNSIIANSSGGNCFGNISANSSSNLADDTSCGTSGFSVSSSMLLGPLGDNGGPTQTFALLPGSPAIEAGDDSACPATDQRGVARPIGAHCDIGAFEFQLLEAITVTSAADDGTGSLREAILGLAPGGTITFAGDTTIHLASELDSDP